MQYVCSVDINYRHLFISYRPASFSRIFFILIHFDLSKSPIDEHFFFFLNNFIYLFIYFWLCWVFVSVRGLSLVAASGGHSSSRAQASHCRGLSCCGAQAPDTQAQ